MSPELSLLRRPLLEFDRALLTASHFGFMPIAAPKVRRSDIEMVRTCGSHTHFDAAEKAALVRTYLEDNLSSLPHPLALIYKKVPRTPALRAGYGMHFIGSASAIAEAALIRTTLSILSEEGHRSVLVDLNCIGDRESINMYERELANFVRKYSGEMTPETRENLRLDVFNLFRFDSPEFLRLRETAPSSLTYLSNASRIYFKEVLEYLEALGVEFHIAPGLVGERQHASHTVFMIRDKEAEGDILAVGYRYSRVGRFLGLRKEIPMAGVTILPKPLKKETREKIFKALPKPKFHLVQLGPEARIKTLTLLELLRTHHIPVYHLLGRDKITVQLTSAEALGVPYLIILGQKEALTNTATIRNVTTRAQDTVGLDALPDFLKHIRL